MVTLTFLAAGAGTAPMSFITGIVASYALLRAWATRRCYHRLVRSPIVLLLLLWLCGHALSLIWSHDPSQGLEDLAIFRLQIPVLLVIWPVARRLSLFFWALCAGVVLMVIAQLLQRVGVEWVIALGWPRNLPGRYSAFLHPTSTALIESTALILACGPALIGRGWVRLAGVAVIIAAVVGLALTGSRGPWIACLAGVGVTVALLAHRRFVVGTGRHPRLAAQAANNAVESRRPAASRNRRAAIGTAGVLAVLGVAAIVGWLLAGNVIAKRVQAATDEIAAALFHDDYSSDTGMRIRQMQLATLLTRQHSWLGVGGGGYRAAALAMVTERDGADRRDESRDGQGRKIVPGPVLHHPHSALFYVACSYGLPSLGVYLLFWVLVFRHAWRRSTGPGHFDAALPGLVVSLFIAYLLDSQNMNAVGTTLLMYAVIAVMPHPERLHPVPAEINGQRDEH